MGAIGRTIRGYILWTYERGTIHYDVMVTLILLFIFGSPFLIKYGDKPVVQNVHLTGVMVMQASEGEYVYQIEASTVPPATQGGDPAALGDALVHLIEPIAGEVTLVGFDPVLDAQGKVQAYKVRVKKR